MRGLKLKMLLLPAFAMHSAAATVAAAEMGGAGRYISADVVAVGTLDFTKLDIAAAIEEVIKYGLVPNEHVGEAREKARLMQQAYAELPRRGARRAYILFRVTDIQHRGPTWVVDVAEEGNAAGVVELLKHWTEGLGSGDALDHPGALLPKEFDVVDGAILAARTPEQLQLLKQSRGDAMREDATAALNALAAADAGLMIVGDKDSRRVVRELFPALPAPFMEIDGRLLADGLRWGGVRAKLPPGPTVTVTIEAVDRERAETLEQAAIKGLELLKAFALAQMIKGPAAHQADAAAVLPVLGLLKPEVDGTRINLTFGDDDHELDALKAALQPAVVAARESAKRSQRLNNLKQIALAFFNYESVEKSFPPAASFDAEGKPLLSWRVHVLPYLEQQDLYNQFHLDEPWDSEHNRQLIAKMPEAYAGDDPLFGEKGRTTIVAPLGEGTVFSGKMGTKLREIADGMSNTIMVVEVIPERGVVWTQPDDWEVDFKDPLRGVKGGENEADGGVFAAAFADGHVKMISDSVDPQAFAAMLTRAGNEPVQP